MLPPLIYYGKSGLEAQIFQTYMASSGYQVQTVLTRDGVLEAIGMQPNAITVIALDKSPVELTELAGELRVRAKDSSNPIFLLGGDEPFDPRMDSVYVITRPFRLSEVITRIQSISRHKKDR
jgi:DNA-binding response OmpR family regulator